MTLTNLKNQIIFNRQQLAALYKYKAELQVAKKFYDFIENQDSEYDAHNDLKVVSKRIAKLVVLQAALKQDVCDIVEGQRRFAILYRMCNE